MINYFGQLMGEMRRHFNDELSNIDINNIYKTRNEIFITSSSPRYYILTSLLFLIFEIDMDWLSSTDIDNLIVILSLILPLE